MSDWSKVHANWPEERQDDLLERIDQVAKPLKKEERIPEQVPKEFVDYSRKIEKNDHLWAQQD